MQGLKLLVQCTLDQAVTIASGETPVIVVEGDAYMLARVAMAINFLRSGCSGVQLVKEDTHCPSKEFRSDLVKFFTALTQEEDERFILGEEDHDPVYFVVREALAL